MDRPRLVRIDGRNEPSDRAIVVIPGMCTKPKRQNMKYVEPLRRAGWDGEIHYLSWDSSTKEHFVRDGGRWILLVLALPGALGLSVAAFVARFRKIHKRAKKTGRKHLPGILARELPGRRISFLAHSLGSYVLYKWMKKIDKYPTDHTIEDIFLCGGTVSRKKKNWPRKAYRQMYNVYNPNDTLLETYKYSRLFRIKEPKSLCGRKIIKSKYVNGVGNIDIGRWVGSSHNKYQLAFQNGTLKYMNGKWIRSHI